MAWLMPGSVASCSYSRKLSDILHHCEKPAVIGSVGCCSNDCFATDAEYYTLLHWVSQATDKPASAVNAKAA